MIERATKRWPDRVPTAEERLARYRDGLVQDDELALRRKHGRRIQGGLFPDPARAYAAEAAATATEVTQEDYDHANS